MIKSKTRKWHDERNRRRRKRYACDPMYNFMVRYRQSASYVSPYRGLLSKEDVCHELDITPAQLRYLEENVIPDLREEKGTGYRRLYSYEQVKLIETCMIECHVNPKMKKMNKKYDLDCMMEKLIENGFDELNPLKE